MEEQQKQSSSDHYPGYGWNFIRLQRLPESITAPATVGALLAVASLLGLGLYLISKLVMRVSDGGADTVPAAGAALTAIAAIIGAIFLTWRTVVAHWQARASQEEAAISKESHFTTLFTKAVEQLGATREIQRREIDETTKPPTHYAIPETQPNLEVRLGAIFVLERIARDSQVDRPAIAQVLCSYVRNPQNCGTPREIKNIPDKHEEFRKWQAEQAPLRLDIQAAVQVLASDFFASEEFVLNFQGANLQGLSLDRLSIPGIVFDRCSLDCAELNNSQLEGSFAGAHIYGATFDAISLRNSNLDEAQISHVRFSGCAFVGSQAIKASLEKVSFDRSDLRYAYFYQASFNNVAWTNCNASWISLKGSRIYSAHFVGCDLSFASFRDVFIYDAVFLRSNISGASFENTTASSIGFFGCDLSNASGLTPEFLSNTKGDIATTLPQGVERPQHWSPLRIDENQIWGIMNPGYMSAMSEAMKNALDSSSDRP